MSSRAALLLGLVALAGCGGSSSAGRDTVRLDVASPADEATVRADAVEVRGSVRPATATVLVAGRRAAIAAGTFSAKIALDPGVNVIDVLASAGDARPALSAVRVRRLVVVRIPDVAGLSPDDATSRLTDLGLEVERHDAGGLLDEIFGGKPAVCRTDPDAGTEVDPGSTVRIDVARRC
jgi:PASTA domain-containing protein/glucodextranase-like protein